jgi:hypothetical protein
LKKTFVNGIPFDQQILIGGQLLCRLGNSLELFYNPENNLLVVDLIHKSETCGNELVRITLNEKKLLKHCKGRKL